MTLVQSTLNDLCQKSIVHKEKEPGSNSRRSILYKHVILDLDLPNVASPDHLVSSKGQN